MRQLLAIVLASTFMTPVPSFYGGDVAKAASLFESLFPRAADRRRKRRERLRLREQEILRRERAITLERLGGSRIKKRATFKVYKPVGLRPVSLVKLAKALSAHEHKLLSQEVLQEEQERLESEKTDTIKDQSADVISISNDASSPVPILPSPSAEPVETYGSVEKPPSAAIEVDAPNAATSATINTNTIKIRLSAAHKQLESIRLPVRAALGKALVAHYASNPEFIWVDEDGKITDNANAVLQVLAGADEYGLRTEDYALPPINVGGDATPEEILQASVEFELSLTAAALRYMADARNGLVDPNGISIYHDFSGLKSDYNANIESLRNSPKPTELLVAAHPKEPAFEVLKAELAELRATATNYDSVTIAPKTLLKPGQVNDQLENIVESIRRKASKELLSDHFDVFAVEHNEGIYSDDVVALVRAFQKSIGLKADGIVGRNTISKMVGDDPNVRTNKVLYAMERLRWHPDALGATHVFINQPAYRATYMQDGQPKLSMRAIVGKPSNQTNFFHDKIEYVEYNPYWGIPRSILVNEMLPKLRANPGYFDNLGYETRTVNGTRISSYDVDWYSVGVNFPFNVRQPPGRKNALGELKIMFPNKHSIYMHDTPAKSLFKRDRRAFSHGCIRLSQPRAMAAAVLGSDIGSISSKLIDGQNKQQKLSRQIPVYVSYYTAWPDSEGNVQFFSDIYGRDNALGKAMELEAQARAAAKHI